MNGLFGKYRLLLAPMAGITDSVYRTLCLEQGANLAFTEMVSAKGLSFANDKTRHLIDLAPVEKSVSVQVFGHEPDIMARQAEWICDRLSGRLVSIDVNMGCPARKIVKKGDGSALMKTPDLAANIISAMKRASNVPVTAKFRRGYYEGDESAPEFARRMEQAGADAVTVHGRYAGQLYRGESDNSCIARVKASVGIPVVGNGDVQSAEDALCMIKETGCDAIMVARASLGCPWIFREIADALEGGVAKRAADVPVAGRIDAMLRHARMVDEHPRLDVKKMRKIAPFYIKGVAGAAKARGELSSCTTYNDYEKVANDLLARVEDHGGV